MYKTTQTTRLCILILYVAILFSISYHVFGTVIPPSSEKGLWFYACLASIILGDLLVSPFFTKPADAISNSVAALIVLLSVNAFTISLPSFNEFIWVFAISFSLFVLVVSILSITLKDSSQPVLNNFSRSFFVMATEIGTPRWVFSNVLLYALVSFHASNSLEFLWISFAWFTLIAFHPLEYFYYLFRRIQDIWSSSRVDTIGEVKGYQLPGVMLIKNQKNEIIDFGHPLLTRGDDGRNILALALDQVGFTDTTWQRAIRISDQGTEEICDSKKVDNPFAVLPLNIDPVRYPELDRQCCEIKQKLVGLVAPETDVTRLKIELLRADLDLHEGRLVQVNISGIPVLYQIINGLTKEEILEQKNTRSYIRGEARKLGQWGGESFVPVKWVPQPNSPVLLLDVNNPDFDLEAIGYISHTEYFLRIDVNKLITHNAAILGILGVGKTYLALELIERMVVRGIKVICLDLTNQYAKELAPYYCNEVEEENINQLKQIGINGRGQVRQNVEEGGSHQQFKQNIANQLREFLEPGNNHFLKIYNPTQFEVWRQDSRPYQNTASMASLTACEITRIISEACLEILQGQGMSEDAKCCLVFEEAHSLVPEWNSVANEGDKTATNGTAKAILQGRKYGLGCLLITQRTANVTKSILNQCNTVFALRSFDSTGIEFLKNFIGEDYSGIISTLEDRHAIVFGKGSSCQTPVIIKLNERDKFLEFRAPRENLNNVYARELHG